ncbi:MAG TPA: adenylosuccinate lyase [Planctomycetes bacterium]|nr:adenylosuccinate lyase [Planctomycetota bacterium]
MDEVYSNPLVERYCSPEMARLFSPRKKFTTWRRLWLALAEAEHELGLPVTREQVEELRAHLDDLDQKKAARYEKELRHDVMAQVHVLRDQCPLAGPIVHLGATSCFVTDNTDLLLIREALQRVMAGLRRVLRRLDAFAMAERSTPCVGYTHFQPAQFTTVGKRACLWLQDLLMDHAELENTLDILKFRGVKGTTGTQDSFLKLFGGDGDKVEALDALVCEKMGFERRFRITGQTYPRKVDARVLQSLSSLGQSAHKMSTDLRLLCHMREVEEPFESKQIGSSAMPYKRNPMRAERVGALSRFLISLADNGAQTAATQWLERTLDDSANRRMSLPLAFMAADAICIILENVAGGLVVRRAVIRHHLAEHVPFIASEELMMRAVEKGGDRQELHEVIRGHALAAANRMKEEGGPNDFLDRLLAEPAFQLDEKEVEELLRPERYVGRAPAQVELFHSEEVEPLLSRFPDDSGEGGPELRV